MLGGGEGGTSGDTRYMAPCIIIRAMIREVSFNCADCAAGTAGCLIYMYNYPFR